jgi:2-polyprenyl-3-methyl-5-hydroxy-6-metoxy-1,4-benzoquinol methylase
MKSTQLWDKLAKNWDKPGVNLGENDVKIVEHIKKYLNAEATVLDYGCATGTIALEIAGQAKSVRGIDISPRMVEIAKRKADERQVKNAEFLQATIDDERLKKESYDIILSLNVLHLLEKPQQAIQRIHELLKPGGVYISATPCRGENKLTSLFIFVPIFIITRIGILPKTSLLSVNGLEKAITGGKFQIMEKDFLAQSPLAEVLITAKKR